MTSLERSTIHHPLGHTTILSATLSFAANCDPRMISGGNASLPLGLAQAVAARLLPDLAEAAVRVQLDEYRNAFKAVQRVGIEGLGKLCERAISEGLDELPTAWLPVE